MSFEPIVNIDSIKDSIAYQYSDSTNLINYIAVLLAPFDELEEVFADILNSRMLDTPTTDSLNTIGELVGQSRLSYDSTEVLFLGLDSSDETNPVDHLGLGDLYDTSIGGILRSEEQAISTVVSLQNNDYKSIIEAKIDANNFKGGTEELIDSISGVLGITTKGSFQIEQVFTTPTDPYVLITFYVTLTALQKRSLEKFDILPRPGGMRYEYIYGSIEELETDDGFYITTDDELNIFTILEE